MTTYRRGCDQKDPGLLEPENATAPLESTNQTADPVWEAARQSIRMWISSRSIVCEAVQQSYRTWISSSSIVCQAARYVRRFSIDVREVFDRYWIEPTHAPGRRTHRCWPAAATLVNAYLPLKHVLAGVPSLLARACWKPEATIAVRRVRRTVIAICCSGARVLV